MVTKIISMDFVLINHNMNLIGFTKILCSGHGLLAIATRPSLPIHKTKQTVKSMHDWHFNCCNRILDISNP